MSILLRIAWPFVVFFSFGFPGCDDEGKQQCDWTLEADPGRPGVYAPGHVPVCARNRATFKQDCRLQITPEKATPLEGKKFRYEDMKIASPALPRTITHIEPCSP